MDHSEPSSSVTIVLILQEYALFVYVFQIATSIFSVPLQCKREQWDDMFVT